MCLLIWMNGTKLSRIQAFRVPTLVGFLPADLLVRLFVTPAVRDLVVPVPVSLSVLRVSVVNKP